MAEEILICELCRSIPFTNIPSRNKRRIVNFGKLESHPPLNYWREKVDTADGHGGYTYHPDFAHLEASAQVCRLCRTIRNEVKQNVYAFDQCSHQHHESFKRLKLLQEPLKIVQRIDDGCGFAVVVNISQRQGDPFVVSLANLCIFVPYGKTKPL